jgi:lysyl-tRNA synthetase, class I
VGLDKQAKTVRYLDKDGKEQNIGYQNGDVKLDWRIDWPARWWLLEVDVEPFGRDHATKGGSYDTGAELIRQVFGHEPPVPVPYDFVNLAGDNKKMSASKGTGLDAISTVNVLPPEIIRFFMLRYPPSKRLYFDPGNGVPQLIDEFAELMSNEPDSPLLEISRRGLDPTISRVPFSHLVASYQAALKNPEKTLELLKRTSHEDEQDTQVLEHELKYIDQWLQNWAPEEIKFELAQSVDSSKFSEAEKDYLRQLADKIAQAPDHADGEWFHKAIYELKEKMNLEPRQVFKPLYLALISKDAGPRAGWFLSILPRNWLIKRLRLED